LEVVADIHVGVELLDIDMAACTLGNLLKNTIATQQVGKLYKKAYA